MGWQWMLNALRRIARGGRHPVRQAKVGLLLVALCCGVWAAGPAMAAALTFAHLSDTHIDTQGVDTNSRLTQDSQALLTDALAQIKAYNQTHATDPVKFVLITGDCVNSPSDANYKALFTILNAAGLPYVLVLGNHDPYYAPHGTKADTLAALKKYANPKLWLAPLPATQGYRTWRPMPGLRFIIVDGTIDTSFVANGYLDAKQLDWLEAQLKEAESQHEAVVVTLHFPPVEPFHSDSHQINPPDAKRFNAIVQASPNVVAVLTGHYHTAKLQTRNGIVHVHSPALVEYPNAFRVLSIDPAAGLLKANWMPTTLTPLQTKSKGRDPSAPLHLGKDKDHSGVFQLRYAVTVSPVGGVTTSKSR
jgi:Icc protein